MSFAEWGPEDGHAVLFCSGAAMSARLGFGGDALDELGVRLVAVDRPGLGGSHPSPGRTLTDFAEDVRAFIAARGLASPHIVGFSQGAPFALACAAAGLVAGAAVVSGTDELAGPALAGALVPDVRALIERVARDPEDAEAFFARMDASTMHDMVVGMSSERDRAVYTDPEFDRAYLEALREGFAQGSSGYARDTVLSMSPWPYDPARISVPVDLWYGEHDTNPTHSPDLGASLARRTPGARRHIRDTGGALLWTHAREILTALLGHTGR